MSSLVFQLVSSSEAEFFVMFDSILNRKGSHSIITTKFECPIGISGSGIVNRSSCEDNVNGRLMEPVAGL